MFFEKLQQNGMIVRPLGPYGMPDYVRITIGTLEENKCLLQLVREHIVEGGEFAAIR
jgi:histidinol-phosphate aminotransferase